MCRLPSRKKVAGTSFSLRMSSRHAEFSLGPASNVSAMHLASRQSTVPNRAGAPGAAWARAAAGAVVCRVVQPGSAKTPAASRAGTARNPAARLVVFHVEIMR
jgi:hypothetical protein